jgi:uncharacterized protein YbbC (DUF1343 family)
MLLPGLLINIYNQFPDKDKFFNSFFEKLAGTKTLRQQIIRGASLAEINESWKPALSHFKSIRRKYLLYADFE